MPLNGRKARSSLSVAVAAAVWLCIGLTLPVVISLYSSDVSIHDKVVAAPRHSFTITHPVSLGQSPTIRVERGTIVLVDQSGRPIPPPPDLANAAAPATGNLLLENATLSLSGIPANAHASENVEALAPLVQALTAVRYDTLIVRRSTFLLQINENDSEPVSDVQAHISLRRKGSVVIKGTGLVRGQRVEFDVAAASLPSDKRGPGTKIPVKISIKAPLVEAQLEGKLAADGAFSLVGQGEMSMRSVRALARWFGAFWTSGPGLRAVSAKGQVELTRQTISFQQASFKVDGNDATGALTVQFGGARPQVSGTLAFKTLDAAPYLTSAPGDEPQEPLSLASVAARVLTVPLGSNLDADLRVSAEKVQLSRLEIGRMAATIALKDGRLLADLAEVQLGSGLAAGQLRADFTGYIPRLGFRGKLDGVDLGPLTAAMSGHPLVQATSTVVADLTASGSTSKDIVSSLGGRLHLKAPEGGRLGIDLRQLAATVQDKEAQGWGSASRGRTGFEQMELKLVLRDGVLLTETADANSVDGGWSATGLLNLATERLDVRLIQTQSAQFPKAPRPVGGKTNAIELRGPWSKPLIRSISDPGSAGAPDLTPLPPPRVVPTGSPVPPDRG